MQFDLKIKLVFILGIFLTYLSLLPTQAQVDTAKFIVSDETKSIGTYSLEDCIKFALENSEALKKAKYQKQISAEEVNERLATGYPQLDFNASLGNNLIIPKVFVPDGSLFGGPPGPLAVAFQTQFSSSASFNLNQQIFDFSYLIGIKGAKAYVELSQKQIKQGEIDIISNVTKAYYAVLINEERLALLDVNYKRLDTVYKNTSAMFTNGMAEKVDVMRTEVSLNNIKTEREKLVKLQEFTYQLLKYQMGMPVRDSLSILGNIRELNLETGNFSDENGNYQDRIEFDILQTNRNLQEINLQYNKSLYLPRLTANASYGWNTGRNQFADIWKFNQSYFRFLTIGASLSIPIIDGFKRRNTVNKLRLEVMKVEEDIKQFKRTVDLQVEQAKNSLVTYSKDLEIQKKNMELAQEVARVAKVKYENGVGSTLEIVNAESSFKEAENNYYTALYNLVLSKVDLDKALGKLGK